MNLVIVESPAKAKTINKYLGEDYIVLASYGHVRDLPSKNGSVDTENNFNMTWEIDPGSKKPLKDKRLYSLKNLFVINNTILPFAISDNKVYAATCLLPVLRTFVAPIFPDPIFLTSPNPAIFA